MRQSRLLQQRVCREKFRSENRNSWSDIWIVLEFSGSVFLAQGLFGLLVHVGVAHPIMTELKAGVHNTYDKVCVPQTLIWHAYKNVMQILRQWAVLSGYELIRVYSMHVLLPAEGNTSEPQQSSGPFLFLFFTLQPLNRFCKINTDADHNLTNILKTTRWYRWYNVQCKVWFLQTSQVPLWYNLIWGFDFRTNVKKQMFRPLKCLN